MKKISFLIVSFLSYILVFSQNFGGEYGINFATIISKNFTNSDLLIGQRAFLIFKSNKNQFIKFAYKFGITQLGFRTFSNDTIFYNRMNYLSFNPELIISNIKSPGILSIGFFSNYLVNNYCSSEYYSTPKNYFTNFDFGINASIGLKTQLSNIIIFTKFSYEIGLTNIYRLDDKVIKNRNFSISVGFLF